MECGVVLLHVTLEGKALPELKFGGSMTEYRLPISFLRNWRKQAWPLCHSWTCNLHSSGLTWPRYHESWVTWCLSQSFMGCVKMVWHDMMYAGTAKLKDIHRCCAMSGWRVAKKQFNLGRYPLHTWRKRLQGCGMINDHETSWIWLQ